MNYEQNPNIENELVNNYPNLQNAYYTGKLSGEKLTNYVTQSFWYSLFHTKKSMDRKGVTIEAVPAGRVSPPRIKAKKTVGDVSVREYHQKVTERKKVYLGDKCIYSKKNRKLYNTTVIDVDTDEREIVCPSCGAKGPASSFVDGCDFCNTRFVINKSENKISSFSPRDNTKSKIVRMFVKLIIALAVIAVILGIAAIVSLGVSIYYGTAIGWYEDPEVKTGAARIFIFATYILPEVLKVIGITFVVFLVVGFFLIRSSTRRIQGEEIVNGLVREIIPEHFAGDLEYKLRSIHYAESQREVSTITTVDLGADIEAYKDVLDTSMNKMTFMDAGICPEGIYVDVEARLNNLRLINTRVKEETERVKVRMLARYDMREQSFESVACHRCAGCGGSVDVFEGGYCMSCGTPIDYGRYNWIVSGYERLGKAPNTFKRTRLLLVGILAAVLLIFGGIFYLNNTKEVYIFMHLRELYNEMSEEFDDIKNFDEVCENAEHVGTEKYDVIRMEKYQTDDFDRDLYSYIEYLLELGFEESDEDQRGTGEYEKVIRFQRRYESDNKYLKDEASYQIILIEFDENGNELNIIYDVE